MELIIHCSDSPYGTAVIVGKWHRLGGFKKIGYHAVILNGKTHSSKIYDEFWDGRIESGRQEGTKGAHTRGHNDAYGVCLIGKSGDFTTKQLDTLKELVINLKKKANRKSELLVINQHSDYEKKKPYCAGLDIVKFIRSL